jgi:hypothetical protein
MQSTPFPVDGQFDINLEVHSFYPCLCNLHSSSHSLTPMRGQNSLPAQKEILAMNHSPLVILLSLSPSLPKARDLGFDEFHFIRSD